MTENPAVGTTEVGEIYNTTGDAHPIHIHEVTVEVLNRQDVDVDEDDQTVQVASDTVLVTRNDSMTSSQVTRSSGRPTALSRCPSR